MTKTTITKKDLNTILDDMCFEQDDIKDELREDVLQAVISVFGTTTEKSNQFELSLDSLNEQDSISKLKHEFKEHTDIETIYELDSTITNICESIRTALLFHVKQDKIVNVSFRGLRHELLDLPSREFDVTKRELHVDILNTIQDLNRHEIKTTNMPKGERPDTFTTTLSEIKESLETSFSFNEVVAYTSAVLDMDKAIIDTYSTLTNKVLFFDERMTIHLDRNELRQTLESKLLDIAKPKTDEDMELFSEGMAKSIAERVDLTMQLLSMWKHNDVVRLSYKNTYNILKEIASISKEQRRVEFYFNRGTVEYNLLEPMIKLQKESENKNSVIIVG